MAKPKNSTLFKLKKEVDSWLAEDYPKLGAIRHPYRSISLTLVWVALFGLIAALYYHSIADGLVWAFMMIVVMCIYITSNKL